MWQAFVPLVGVALFAAAVAAGLATATQPSPPEPLGDFNHRAHVEVGLECADCHRGVGERAAAGVPPISVCTECHEVPEEEVDLAALDAEATDALLVQVFNGKVDARENAVFLLRHFLAGEEPWWPRLYALPDHVVFSHRRHVAIGGLACARCHGDLETTETLPRRPVRETLTMDGCLDCHERSGASTDCFACHR